MGKSVYLTLLFFTLAQVVYGAACEQIALCKEKGCTALEFECPTTQTPESVCFDNRMENCVWESEPICQPGQKTATVCGYQPPQPVSE